MSDSNANPKIPLCEPVSDDPNADAVVRLGASSDRMRLGVVCYTPASGHGAPVDVDMLVQAARKAGVATPIDPDAAQRAVEMLLAGKDARLVVIARGVPAVAPQDARLEPYLDLTLPVFPDMVFAKLHALRRAEAGSDLAGNELPPPAGDEPKDIVLGSEPGCTRGWDGTLTASLYGMVRLAEGELMVKPLVKVAKNRLAVAGTLYPKDATGEIITVRRLEDELERQGVVLGIRLEEIQAALERAQETGRPVKNVVLARGRKPVDGTDAQQEILYEEQAAHGVVDEHDRMDFRERGFIPVVGVGQDLVRLSPATSGEPGMDVFGKELPASKGKPLSLKAGKNVEVIEGGRDQEGAQDEGLEAAGAEASEQAPQGESGEPGAKLFRSQSEGVVVLARGRIEVSDLVVIPGDVDLESGNVRLMRGSVRIQGAVRSGFAVEAPGSVYVDNAVEDASIVAGGDVSVRGGIVMAGDSESEVRAEGNVSAYFAQNARILAGGNVEIARYIARSDVQAGFKVRAEGHVRVTEPRGRIMGGTVVSGRGIEAYEVGSYVGVATTLVLTREDDKALKLIQEKRVLRRQVKQISKYFSEITPDKIAGLAADKRARIKKILERGEKARARLRAIAAELAELARCAMDCMEKSQIVIKGTVNPGVVIKMGGKSLHVENPLPGARFFWDPSNRAIAMDKI